MDFEQIIDNRAIEIRELIMDGNINRAIKRFIDFGGDFSADNNQINYRIIAISSAFNETEKQFNNNVINYEDIKISHAKIITEILSLLSEIINISIEHHKNNKKKTIKTTKIEPVFIGKEIGKFYENFKLNEINLELA